MNSQPSFEILESLPTSGPMYISITRDNSAEFYSEGFVVRFFKSDGIDWIAQPGWTNLRTVIKLKNSMLMVIASGICYVINPEEQIPSFIFGVGYEEMLKTENGIYILQDQTKLTIIDEFGNYFHSEQISYDGIKELSLDENGLVKGVSYYPTPDDDEWIPFTYDIEKRKLIGGSFGGDIQIKKWWKFW